eukprot:TRINITY_DN67804_c5_g1_i1.p2 TRINITY_DN67804_c5_g1~~TRINITY_DN67804_c5_g1_i1.p2  ORF type:complete len:121 (+),score=4.82 TRINITY_DN67804_c5_g1_i1:442-804(+)
MKNSSKKFSACVVSGFFSHAAHRVPDGTYVSIHGGLNLRIHPSSTLCTSAPSWILYYEVLETEHLYMRECMALDDPMWLVQVAPHFYNYESRAQRTARAATQPNAVESKDVNRASNWLFV